MSVLLRMAALCWLGAAAALVDAAEFQVWKGGPAPALELRAIDGGLQRLTDYRGRVVLVNFWATWCEPCRDEMPSIQRLKDKLSGRPFSVVAVNLDEPESRIHAFLSRTKVTLPVLLDPGRRAARAWNARILPATYIVGADGRIRYYAIGELEWDNEQIVSRITELLPAGKQRRE